MATAISYIDVKSKGGNQGIEISPKCRFPRGLQRVRINKAVKKVVLSSVGTGEGEYLYCSFTGTKDFKHYFFPQGLLKTI